jgi:hypothetical protein
MYDADERFMALYHRFLRDCLSSFFGWDFYFQATVTVRIHCPDGANNHHYPRYHNDVGYGHPPQEINLWIPLTEPQGAQRHGFRLMNIEQTRGILGRFGYDFPSFIDKAINDKAMTRECEALAVQMDVPLGACLAFDSRSIHSGEPLREHTRISMDVRVIPVKDFEAMPFDYQGTGRRQMLFTPGHGYYPKAASAL